MALIINNGIKRKENYNKRKNQEPDKNFESIVKDIGDKHVPRIKKKVQSIYCPWRALGMCELIKTREYHLGKVKKSSNDNDHKKYRNKVTASIRISEVKYNQNLITQC